MYSTIYSHLRYPRWIPGHPELLQSELRHLEPYRTSPVEVRTCTSIMKPLWESGPMALVTVASGVLAARALACLSLLPKVLKASLERSNVRGSPPSTKTKATTCRVSGVILAAFRQVPISSLSPCFSCGGVGGGGIGLAPQLPVPILFPDSGDAHHKTYSEEHS